MHFSSSKMSFLAPPGTLYVAIRLHRPTSSGSHPLPPFFWFSLSPLPQCHNSHYERLQHDQCKKGQQTGKQMQHLNAIIIWRNVTASQAVFFLLLWRQPKCKSENETDTTPLCWNAHLPLLKSQRGLSGAMYMPERVVCHTMMMMMTMMTMMMNDDARRNLIAN